MDKSNHRITVDREYLERLEKFYEENGNTKENIHGIISVNFGFTKTLLLRENKITGDNDISMVAVIDTSGKELMKFSRLIL